MKLTMGDPKIPRRQDGSHLAWLDLEMTGLDPSQNVILQAALLVTDKQLSPLEEYCCDIWQPESALTNMTPFVRAMHDRNGLLERVRTSTIDLAQAERELLTRVSGWCPLGAVLCGNSVGHDKRFVERWMPGLAGYLGYRIVDVSSVKMLARLWYGEDALYKKPVEGEHDALVDIRNSVAELKHYRQNLFR